MAEKFELVATAGPLAGQRFPIPTLAPMLIGRSSKGVHLADPQVSLEHAELNWSSERLWIKDLGSQTGTFVGGERIGQDPVPLGLDTDLVIGESTFRVEAGSDAGSQSTVVLAGLLVIVIGIAVLGWLATRPVSYRPTLVWSEPVRQGATTSPRVAIPTRFVRKVGRDHRAVQLRRVTDFDKDGIDELWIAAGPTEHVYAFDAQGRWLPLGEVPKACDDRAKLTFPDLDCHGVRYQMVDGAYAPVGHDGVVVWVPPDPTAAERTGPKGLRRPTGEHPRPFRVNLIQPERLAGFLAARGVTEPVHYLVCEDLDAGLRAQVLTARGELVPLAYGCIRGASLQGSRRQELGRAHPMAVAFTAVGREALARDFATALGGSPEGMFLDQPQRVRVAAFSQEPESWLGTIKLAFEGAEAPVLPSAPEEDLDGTRALLRVGDAPAPPLATTATAYAPGTFRLDPPGCSVLEVETRAWSCLVSRWCLPGRTFLTVREVGCGPRVLLESPYRGGVFAAKSGEIEVRARVDSLGKRGRLDVLRARVSYRGGAIAGDEEPAGGATVDGAVTTP